MSNPSPEIVPDIEDAFYEGDVDFPTKRDWVKFHIARISFLTLLWTGAILTAAGVGFLIPLW